MTKKHIIIIAVLFCLSIALPQISYARSRKTIYREDTVTESIWDWVTTLGKSPKEKQRIKNQRRAQRAKKSVERKREAKIKERQKLNMAREREAQEMREAYKRQKRKKLEEKKRGQK